MSLAIFDTHVCLVSAQAVPNLTPALDPKTAPRRVVLVVSPDMAGRAADLERVLRPRSIVVERWPVANAYDIERHRGIAAKLLSLPRSSVGV